MIPTAPSTDSLWLDTATQANCPSLLADIEADVVIIGGGLAGVSFAWHLLEGGLNPERLVLLESRNIASRASGRNAGFLLADFAEPYGRLKEAMGDGAARLRHLSLRNQEWLKATAAQLEINWQWSPDGVLVAAASAHEEEEYRASVQALTDDGFPVDFLAADALSERLASPNAFGGMFDPAGGGCHPACFVLELAKACMKRGARFFEQSEVIHLDSESVVAQTARGSVRAARLVLAINAYAPLLDDTLASLIAPTRGQMLSFPPVADRVLKPVVYRNHGFEYFRQDMSGRFVFGGFRQTAEALEVGYEETPTSDVQAGLCDFARQLYPQLQALEPEYRWAGTMGFSVDGMPFVGPHPHKDGILLCLGFTGHGFGLASECAKVGAALLLEGSHPDAELFSPR
ncbi:MAG: FAD-binding oxidoreductase, partial [Planctomycetes bacterium]|nr:FAD-binding oxidoreductase [Planctomycetota bacterium]